MTVRLLTGVLLAIFISTALVSCGGGGDDDVIIVVKVPMVVQKIVEEKVEVPPPANPEQIERNPFMSYLTDDADDCKDDDPRLKCKEKGPLQRYALRTYRLTTVMVMAGKVRGVVRDKESNMHSVFIGDNMGLRGGKVVEIGSGRIVVEEPIRWNDDGSVAAVDRVEIMLPEDKR